MLSTPAMSVIRLSGTNSTVIADPTTGTGTTTASKTPPSSAMMCREPEPVSRSLGMLREATAVPEVIDILSTGTSLSMPSSRPIEAEPLIVAEEERSLPSARETVTMAVAVSPGPNPSPRNSTATLSSGVRNARTWNSCTAGNSPDGVTVSLYLPPAADSGTLQPEKWALPAGKVLPLATCLPAGFSMVQELALPPAACI
mmetsp:Transcript_14643/g.57472  ORF Transcript_14643/g.57472 Transcript_14643/m.57472 type:complete len:200 (+) Transcript_14643:1923-2522(+)